MPTNKIKQTLSESFPVELVDSLFEIFQNAIKQYRAEEWRYFGNDIGQFIEIAFRLIEYGTSGKYTNLKDKLPIFNEPVLVAWENRPKQIDESLRVIIPRILYSMYCIRNKRGAIHKNHIDPNKMDAIVQLTNMKWVLSELFRLTSSLSFNDTLDIVEQIMNKEESLLWRIDNKLRILNEKISCPNQVLLLLYYKSPQTEKELLEHIEYSNISRFREILKRLHQKRLIEFNNQICTLSPKGELEIASLLKNRNARETSLTTI